jgi:hypothetical protein
MKPRNALIISALFGVIGSVYGLVSHDAAGATMLLTLAIGMGVMAYVLLAGVPRQS